MEIKVLEKSTIDNNTQNQIFDLFKQLSPNKKQLSLNEILSHQNSTLLICCFIENTIVGIATIATYKVISGSKGWIEDVVVDEKYRNKGIGRKIIEKILLISKEKDLDEVLLFTEQHRTSALNLYENLGFKQKNSNIYIIRN